jgi:hypothetical protein
MGSAMCQPKNLISKEDIITPTLPKKKDEYFLNVKNNKAL